MTSPPVALITGAASGIGLALSHLLSQQGFRLVLCDSDEAGLDRARARLAGGNLAVTIRLDVTIGHEIDAAIKQVARRYGRIDYLFNNAGVGGTLDVRHATLAQWQRIVDVNLMGVIHGVQAAYPIMVEQRGGHIVNTASISGLIPWPGQTLYNTTKYAVVGLSHTLRAEAARFGVRVSVVCPGAVRSAIWGTPILGPRADRQAPPDAITAENAATSIWRGVEANRATIIFPRRSELAALLYRMHPDLLRRSFRRGLRQALPSETSR